MFDYRYMTVDKLMDLELYQKELNRLPWRERRERACKYRFDKDKRLCVGAGILAMELMDAHGVTDYTLDYNEYGKPFLKNEPDIYFNLSHSGNMAVCAVSDAAVGVDVEEIQGYDPGVVESCFTNDEQEWLMAQEDRDRAFISLWIRKESYLKALGNGLSMDPGSFSVFDISRKKEWIFMEEETDGKLICACRKYEKADVIMHGR